MRARLRHAGTEFRGTDLVAGAETHISLVLPRLRARPNDSNQPAGTSCGLLLNGLVLWCHSMLWDWNWTALGRGFRPCFRGWTDGADTSRAPSHTCRRVKAEGSFCLRRPSGVGGRLRRAPRRNGGGQRHWLGKRVCGSDGTVDLTASVDLERQ